MINLRTLTLGAMILPALALAACDNKKEEAAPADAAAVSEETAPTNAEMGIDMPQPEAVENAAPVMEAPAMDAPVMDAPAMEAPVAEDAAPAVEAPVTEEAAPAMEAPVMEAPAMTEPTMEAPAVEAPAAEEGAAH